MLTILFKDLLAALPAVLLALCLALWRGVILPGVAWLTFGALIARPGPGSALPKLPCRAMCLADCLPFSLAVLLPAGPVAWALNAFFRPIPRSLLAVLLLDDLAATAALRVACAPAAGFLPLALVAWPFVPGPVLGRFADTCACFRVADRFVPVLAAPALAFRFSALPFLGVVLAEAVALAGTYNLAGAPGDGLTLAPALDLGFDFVPETDGMTPITPPSLPPATSVTDRLRLRI